MRMPFTDVSKAQSRHTECSDHECTRAPGHVLSVSSGWLTPVARSERSAVGNSRPNLHGTVMLLAVIFSSQHTLTWNKLVGVLDIAALVQVLSRA